MVQIYEQVVSDIENKDTHCKWGFCSTICPRGPIFAKSSRPGVQGFDHVKKCPGVCPGTGGCSRLELIDALTFCYSHLDCKF